MASPTDYVALYLFGETGQHKIVDETGDYPARAFQHTNEIAADSSTIDLLLGPGHLQGYSTDGDVHFATSTEQIGRWNNDYSTLTHNNTSPFTGLTGSPDHLGDCCYYNGYLYVMATSYTDCTTNGDAQIVRYDADDLTYVDHKDISADVPGGASGVTIDADNGYIYISDFCNSDRFYRCSLSTMEYVDTITINGSFSQMQGVDYDDGILFFLSGDSSRVYMCTLDGEYIGRHILDENAGQGIYVNGDTVRCGELSDSKVYEFNIGASNTAGEFDIEDYTIAIPYLPTDEGTFIFNFQPTRLFNFNSVYSNLVDPNDWEGWVYSDGRLAMRIDGTQTISTGLSAGTTYTAAFTWEGSGANRTCKGYLDGALDDTQTQPWVTPEPVVWLGGTEGNEPGEHIFYDFAIFDRALTLTEIQDWDPTTLTLVSSGVSGIIGGPKTRIIDPIIDTMIG